MKELDYYKKHLVISQVLNRYEQPWFVIGTLTHKHRTPPPVQMERFRSLMDTLGGVNQCHGKRLHWFARVEGDGKNKNHHLHFLLGEERILNGYHRPLSRADTCEFLSRNWDHGMSEVVPFTSREDGVGYVTKIDSERERDDVYEMSDGLKKIFMKETTVQPLAA